VTSARLQPITFGPAASFDQPLDMVAACHERVERSLDLLRRLQQYVQSCGVDPSARDAARDVRRYFNLATPAHHQDEEQHVLPLLAASVFHEDRALAAKLLAQHKQLERAWAAMDAVLASVEAADSSHGLSQTAVREFTAMYRAHLALEDEKAFPAFERLLQTRHDAAAYTAAMGREMAQRRGVKPAH
jgi:hemerythrin-like domain-containing protein